MASLNSVTGTLSSTASLRGYGGLSSGLDRDSLIESLTYATRSKIEAQQAKKEKLGWEQTILRSVIDKAYNFTNTYASYASTTNLASSSFFARNNVSAVGDNSKYITVSGTATSAATMTVMGVKQLAENARLAGSTASSSQLTTGALKLGDADYVNVDQLEGNYITVKVGSNTYHADIKAMELKADMTDAEKNAALEKALNDAFKNTDAGEGKLSDSISASVDANGIVTFTKHGGNAVEITGGSALEKLGFDKEKTYDFSAGTAVGETKNTAVETVLAKNYLAGKSLTFNYNGTSKSITIGDGVDTLDALQADLQKKLDEAFGKGRIEVGTKDGALTFTTMNVQDGGIDSTSTLSITGGSKGLLGADGVLGIESGATNRVALSKSLAEAGIAGASNDMQLTIGNGIVSKTFSFKKDDGTAKTVQEVMNEINSDKDLNVTISYQANADRFSIASNESGASGKIILGGDAADALFGAGTKDKVISGQDAIIAVKYAGDSEVTEIYRGTNSFTMDGLTVNVNGTFGYNGDTVIGDSEAVKFEAKANVDSIMKGITDMVNAYNEVVALINSELKTKPDSDYKSPLTGTQKEDMSDDDIEDYEKKAKQGLLFGDSDLRSFANELRYVLAGSDIAKFAEIGITESTEYSDNGKLVIDEAKLRAALESDPEKVGELFAGKDNADGTSTAGLVDNMKTVMDKYCGTVGATKGLLVARAGSEHSPLSLLDNTMKTEMDEIADFIETLLDRLESEEDRYIRQFTTLETLISEMNSQSSYLSSISSY